MTNLNELDWKIASDTSVTTPPPIGFVLSAGCHINGYPKVFAHSYGSYRGNWTVLVPNRFGQHSAGSPQPALWRTCKGAEGYKDKHSYVKECEPIEIYPNDYQLLEAAHFFCREMLDALCDPRVDAEALLDRIWATARSLPGRQS